MRGQSFQKIDDHPRHFERFRGEGISFTAPLDLNEHRYHRVGNWQEMQAFFEE